MNRYHFIVNPKSGTNLDLSVIRRLCQRFKESNSLYRIDISQSIEHVSQLARQAVAQEAKILIATGGDGTIRTVIQTIQGSDLPLLIIPGGTENLLACEMGLDGSYETTINTLEHGKIRELDIARINDNFFMAVAGVGFDAKVIERMNRVPRGHISHADYIWPICRTFWEYPIPHVKVVADGEVLCDEPAMAFVGNICRYATGLEILPYADGFDGLLDVTIFKTNGRMKLMYHALMTVLGQTRLSRSVVRTKCKRVQIQSSKQDVPVQIDGDPGPSLPLDIEVRPAAVRLLTPPTENKHKFAPPLMYYLSKRWLTR